MAEVHKVKNLLAQRRKRTPRKRKVFGKEGAARSDSKIWTTPGIKDFNPSNWLAVMGSMGGRREISTPRSVAVTARLN